MDDTNLYDILGVSKHATFEEIKAKYKSLAQQHHPDKGGDPEVFKKIKNAYEILSDPANRKKYDTTGNYENVMSIRDEALSQLSRLFFNLLPNINPDVDDLILIMKGECRREKENINQNIHTCKSHMFKLNTIINKTKKKKNSNENIIKMFAQNQLKNCENDLYHFMRQTRIIDDVIEILEDYQYGDIAILIESFLNPTSANTSANT